MHYINFIMCAMTFLFSVELEKNHTFFVEVVNVWFGCLNCLVQVHFEKVCIKLYFVALFKMLPYVGSCPFYIVSHTNNAQFAVSFLFTGG